MSIVQPGVAGRGEATGMRDLPPRSPARTRWYWSRGRRGPARGCSLRCGSGRCGSGQSTTRLRTHAGDASLAPCSSFSPGPPHRRTGRCVPSTLEHVGGGHAPRVAHADAIGVARPMVAGREVQGRAVVGELHGPVWPRHLGQLAGDPADTRGGAVTQEQRRPGLRAARVAGARPRTGHVLVEDVDGQGIPPVVDSATR